MFRIIAMMSQYSIVVWQDLQGEKKFLYVHVIIYNYKNI